MWFAYLACWASWSPSLFPGKTSRLTTLFSATFTMIPLDSAWFSACSCDFIQNSTTRYATIRLDERRNSQQQRHVTFIIMICARIPRVTQCICMTSTRLVHVHESQCARIIVVSEHLIPGLMGRGISKETRTGVPALLCGLKTSRGSLEKHFEPRCGFLSPAIS